MPHVNIFDFDGVLADPLEEGLFNLPLGYKSQRLVEAVTRELGLDLRGESAKSAHYICMQAVLWQSCIPIETGPMFEKVYEGPYHILTARSDRFAVTRLHEFLIDPLPQERHLPVKIMHVDHLPKGQVLEMLLDRHPENTYTFYDDREKHIQSARELKNPRLDIFHVDNDMAPVYERASTFYERILDLAL